MNWKSVLKFLLTSNFRDDISGLNTAQLHIWMIGEWLVGVACLVGWLDDG